MQRSGVCGDMSRKRTSSGITVYYTDLEAVNVTVERADRFSKAGAVRSPVLVSKIKNLKSK